MIKKKYSTNTVNVGQWVETKKEKNYTKGDHYWTYTNNIYWYDHCSTLKSNSKLYCSAGSNDKVVANSKIRTFYKLIRLDYKECPLTL